MNLLRSCWCSEAQLALAGTFSAEVTALHMAQMVDAGTAQLWQVNGDSWLITGIERDRIGRYLFVWCYAGTRLREVADGIVRIARRNKLERVQFITRHKGLSRLISNVAPQVVRDCGNGETLYLVGVSNV